MSHKSTESTAAKVAADYVTEARFPVECKLMKCKRYDQLLLRKYASIGFVREEICHYGSFDSLKCN